MYYRVAGLKKDENSKEMIIKASSRQEAESLIPAAKQFLFPGEDATNYQCCISEHPIKVNLGTTISHYKIRIERPPVQTSFDNDDVYLSDGWEAIISAPNHEEAIKTGQKMLAEDLDNPDDFDIYADEMTLEEVIQDEERRMNHWIKNIYIANKNNQEMSAREYVKFCREFKPDENREQRYEMLNTVNRYFAFYTYCLSHFNMKETTVDALQERVHKMVACKDRKEMEKLTEDLNK